MSHFRQWLHILQMCVVAATPAVHAANAANTTNAAHAAAPAPVSVIDDTGHTVTLSAPARRIISLAPHVTELLFAAGAGADVVGVSAYSNFPPEAQHLPIVSNAFALDLERIAQLRPDLIVIWNSGNSARLIDSLQPLGVPVFRSEPRDFTTIATSLERLGRLAGTEAQGTAAAQAFRSRLKQLEVTYHDRTPVTVFYQISRSPPMTLNGQHLVSAAIRLCGGVNVFAHLPKLVPTVDVEAVLQADPQAILASTGAHEDPFSTWRRFPRMTAVAKGNLLTVNTELLNRASPRMLDGVESLCKRLDEVRKRK